MKKMIVSFVVVLFSIAILTGCGAGNNVKVDKLNSKINYIEFDGRKIYLTKNLEQFVMQLKGLNCTLSANNTNLTGKLEIDSIDTKDNIFYSLKGHNEVEINCPTDISYSEIEIILELGNKDGKDDDSELYINKPIYYWRIRSLSKNVIVGGNKVSLLLGDDPDINNVDDIEKVLGTDYKSENDNIFASNRLERLIYEDNDYKYEFRLSYESAIGSSTEGQYIGIVYVIEK